MIQILLLIFKIIGWIILGILGILILLTSIFLIVPVRYQGTLLGEGELEKLSASLRFSWLCSLIKGEVCYRNGDFQWKMRLAWKQLSSEQLEKGSSPESQPTEEPVCQSKKTAEEDSFYKTVQKKETEKQEAIPEKSTEKGSSPESQPTEEPVCQSKKTAEEDSFYKTVQKKETEKQEAIPEKSTDAYEKKNRKKNPETKQKPGDWIQEKIQQIKCTFYKICDMLKSLAKKKDVAMNFLTNETHRAAFSKGLMEICRLIRFLKPTQCEADVEFGFSDPSVTGCVLAGASLIYPFVGECVDITPNFDERILKGNAWIKGRIHALYFLIVLWNLLWNKNIRTTISMCRYYSEF